MKVKTCFKCGRTLSIDHFYKHSGMADGHLNKCKECTKNDLRSHAEENPDAVLATRLRVCSKNPNQRNAYRVVEAAVKAEAITKPQVCQGCGCSDNEHRIEAHHYDYSKPLDVIWLCTPCHRQMDKLRRKHENLKGHPNMRQVLKIQDGVIVQRYESIAEAAEDVGRSTSAIKQCLRGISKTCAGFEWRYGEDNQ